MSSCSVRNRNRLAQATTCTGLPWKITWSPCGQGALPQGQVAIDLLAVLIEPDDFQPPGAIDRAVLRLQLAGENSQQRSFAAAVAADQPQAIAGRQRKADFAEQRSVAKAHLDVFDRE